MVKRRNIMLVACLIVIVINSFSILNTRKQNVKDYNLYREVVEYTSSHKENAYVYPNVLSPIFLSYSVYERIADGTFSNLRMMGDWDIYNQEYYDFKETYKIDNIMTDLYKKDNLYIIEGDAYCVNNSKLANHIDVVIRYIKEHYNKEIEYKVIKEFSNSIKIYKLFEKE